jgi:hypothetical protein
MNTTEIVQSIDHRLQDAQAEIERFQGAKLALLNGSKPDKPPARRRPTRQPRKPKVIPAGQLLKLVADNIGQTTTSLAKLAEADRNQVLGLLRDAHRIRGRRHPSSASGHRRARASLRACGIFRGSTASWTRPASAMTTVRRFG